MNDHLSYARDLLARITKAGPGEFFRKPHICLVMIVKNDAGSDEFHVLERCLNSVLPIVSSLAPTFTQRDPDASPGQCIPLVKEWCVRNRVTTHGHTFKWVDDFAAARNYALQWALPESEWLMFMDSDEILKVHDPEREIFQVLRQAKHDAYAIPLVTGHQVTRRITLVRNKPGWSFVGAYHEALTFDDGQEPPFHPLGNFNNPVSGPFIYTSSDGARSRDPETKERACAQLRKVWEETRAPLYLFYLGVELAGAERYGEAIQTLQEFIKEGDPFGMSGLVYHALLTMGRVAQRDHQEDKAIAFWDAAIDVCPSRVEALGELARYHHDRKEWARCRLYATACAMAPRPDPKDTIFTEPSWAGWRGEDLLCAALLNTGQLEAAGHHLQHLLNEPMLPLSERPRLEAYLRTVLTTEATS
jgi:tetratricopeptide (TPR) repeat protein